MMLSTGLREIEDGGYRPAVRRRQLAAAIASTFAFGTVVLPGHAMAMSSAHGAGNVVAVTSCADDGGSGTLRSVLMAAAEGDVVDLTGLDCDQIVLDSRIDISVVGERPEPLLDVTLQGPGADQLTISGNGATDLFLHGGNGPNGVFNIQDLRLADGSTTGGLGACLHSYAGIRLERVAVDNCHSQSNLPVNFGGAIGTNSLVMIDSRITGSSSRSTSRSAQGGGAQVGDSAEIVNSVISGNEVSVTTPGANSHRSGGGGLYVRGTLSITGSTISGNGIDAGDHGRGGGVFVRGAAEIVDTLVAQNTASGDGGGINKFNYTNYGDNITAFSLTNTTISGNAAARGGGVASTRPTTIRNSTIAFNEASGAVGGFFRNDGGAASVDLIVDSSLFAGNGAGDVSAHGADFGYEAAVVLAGGHNLVQVPGPTVVPGDTLTGDPGLLPLADNGGPTFTHALADGSVAIDAGSNVEALAFDQRGDGFPRVVGDAADIGAYEADAAGSDVIFQHGFEPGEGGDGD